MELQAVQSLAQAEMKKHGLSDWKFRFNQAKRRLGVCKYKLKAIEISEYYAQNNSESSIRDTILHEIAHALAGPLAKHGPAWKTIARKIGATPEACDRSPDTIVQPGDWQATCPSCARVIHLYRRPKSLEGYRCACPAKSPLKFVYTGDPNTPPAERVVRTRTEWVAICPSCEHKYTRARRPKAGVWMCRCAARAQLTWKGYRYTYR